MNLNKLTEGQHIKIDNKLYEVFDVRSATVTIVPIVIKTERGAIKVKCDFTRKPLVFNRGGAK